jgi:uncharacterized protein YndB with AHSA1/START domain
MMVKRSITVHAPASRLWKALTDPALVKQYLFGTTVESDWKKGSPITYSGEWQEKTYRDKGTILEVQENKKLQHSYWSSLSGTEDKPENYYTVTYDLEPSGDDTKISITQEGNMTEASAEHSGKNWEMVLEKIKELVEKS